MDSLGRKIIPVDGDLRPYFASVRTERQLKLHIHRWQHIFDNLGREVVKLRRRLIPAFLTIYDTIEPDHYHDALCEPEEDVFV